MILGNDMSEASVNVKDDTKPRSFVPKEDRTTKSVEISRDARNSGTEFTAMFTAIVY